MPRLPQRSSLAEIMLGKRLRALANHRRRALFLWILKRSGEAEYRAMLDEFELPMATLSRHLDSLKDAGLITTRRDYRHLIATVDPQGLADLVDHLTAWAELANSKRR